MKKLYVINIVLAVLSSVGAVIFLNFLPEQIPVHYNFAGEVDRIGSKYEMLFFTVLIILMCAIFLPVARNQGKKGEKSGEKGLLFTALFTTVLFSGIGFYAMAKGIQYVHSSMVEPISADFMRFISIALGVFFIGIGFLMPGIQRNSTFGLRTKWSTKNDELWKKNQRMGGAFLVVLGVIMILLSAFISGLGNLWMILGGSIVWGIVCIIGSFLLYKREKRKN